MYAELLDSKVRVANFESVSVGCRQMRAFLSTFKGSWTQVSAAVYELVFPAPYLGAVTAKPNIFLYWSLTDPDGNLEEAVSICTCPRTQTLSTLNRWDLAPQ